MSRWYTCVPEPDLGPAPGLSVVVPAFNEADRLPPSLETILAYLRASGRTYELIVVDDGSRDRTVEMVAAVGVGEGEMRLVKHPLNLGKGAAVRTGVLASRGEIVLFTDADLSTPITDAEPLIRAIEAGADVAIGSRAIDRSLVEVHQPFYRETRCRLFYLSVHALLLPSLYDNQYVCSAFPGHDSHNIFSTF